jgi:hypothetical protein
MIAEDNEFNLDTVVQILKLIDPSLEIVEA